MDWYSIEGQKKIKIEYFKLFDSINQIILDKFYRSVEKHGEYEQIVELLKQIDNYVYDYHIYGDTMFEGELRDYPVSEEGYDFSTPTSFKIYLFKEGFIKDFINILNNQYGEYSKFKKFVNYLKFDSTFFRFREIGHHISFDVIDSPKNIFNTIYKNYREYPSYIHTFNIFRSLVILNHTTRYEWRLKEQHSIVLSRK